MKIKYRYFWGLLLIPIFIAVFAVDNVSAAARDQGPDWSKYQGNNGEMGYSTDKFAIAQIGGTYGGTIINQTTYSSQIKSAKSHSLRAHTYMWYGVGGSQTIAKRALDYYLPRVKTPKGSIVALDYEDGASGSITNNTNAIIYGMKRIKAAGYTPMYYSYKPYTLAHVNYKAINKQFKNSLWIAMYPNYLVTKKPNYNYFPSMTGVAIFQFTSTYRAGGLDGNVDLTGITKNGYTKNTKPKTKPAKKVKMITKSSSYAQRGIFKANRKVYIHNGLGGNTKIVSYYIKGQSVAYNKIYIRSTGYVWARYKSYSGASHYICIGKMGGASYGSRYVY